VTKESDVNRPGGGHNLRNYWVKGPGAVEIGWGTDGSFARCVAKLSSKVKNPQGLCAEYHKAATGEWPAEKGVESSMDGMVEAHGTHNQQDHDPTKGKSDLDKLKSLVGMKPGDVKVPKSKSGLTSEKIRGTKAKEPLDDRPGPYEEDDEDTRGVIGGDIDYGKDDDDFDDDYDGGDILTPGGKSNLKRLQRLEDKLESNAGLSESENRELKRLRKLLGNQYDDDNDFALTTVTKKREKSDDKDEDEDDMESYATGDGDEPWDGVLTVEGIESGDGRLFALGGLDWATLPMPLMYQPANVGGHNGSIMVGNIQAATRHGSRIRGKGVVFGSALAGQYGDDIRHMMETGGVSVDVDKVKDADVEMVYADDESGDGTGNMFAKPETTIFHRGRIRGATLVAFPAFVEAKLAFTNANETLTAASCGCDDEDPLVASVHTITIPNLPKAEWFNEPTDVKVTGALTITDEGRVFGVVAPSDTTHRSVKTRVPRSLDFSRFHKGETIVEGGGRVVTGVITAGCPHAPTENYGTLQRRMEHYDNSCSVLANVRVGYGRTGAIWVAGALNPGADPKQVAQALGCTLSLDVQPHPDRPGIREFIAAHLVPVPGFPMARTQASVTYEDGALVASSVPVVRGEGVRSEVDEVYFNTYNWIQSAKQLLLASAGMDPASRKREIMSELEDD
jgi:hypothetical protein